MILDESINFRCKAELKEDLQKLAKENDRRFSDYMNLILAGYVLEQKDRKEKSSTK